VASLGGPPSVETLYGRHGPRIRRLCRLLLRDATEAEDAAQEVLLKLVQERHGGRTHDAWDRWLTRVTVNTCRDRRRSGWWRRWREDHHELRDDHLTTAETPEQVALGVETRGRIWVAFRALPARQREVFALRHVEGFSTAEVAAALGLSEGTAKRHLFRAVHRLRATLGGER